MKSTDEPNANPKLVRTERGRQLKCRLTESERRERSEALVDVLGELDRLVEELKEVKAQFKRRETSMQTRRGSLQAALATGAEFRPVDVEHWADYEAGVVREVRTDTSEAIDARPLREHERQPELDFEDEDEGLEDEVAGRFPTDTPAGLLASALWACLGGAENVTDLRRAAKATLAENSDDNITAAYRMLAGDNAEDGVTTATARRRIVDLLVAERAQ